MCSRSSCTASIKHVHTGSAPLHIALFAKFSQQRLQLRSLCNVLLPRHHFLTNIAANRVTALLVPRWNTCVVGRIWTLLTCFTAPSFRFFALFPEDGRRKMQDTSKRSYTSSKPPSEGSCNVRNATDSWRKGKARVTDAETRKLYVFKNEIASHLRRLPSKMN